MFCITLTELFNSSGSIYQFLFTGEKRMAGRTDFHIKFRQDAANFYFITTGTNSHYGFMVRVYIFFHIYPTALQKAFSLG